LSHLSRLSLTNPSGNPPVRNGLELPNDGLAFGLPWKRGAEGSVYEFVNWRQDKEKNGLTIRCFIIYLKGLNEAGGQNLTRENINGLGMGMVDKAMGGKFGSELAMLY